MTVVFVAPDESDDEELSNCDVENHLKYQLINDEIERKRRSEPNNSSSSEIETVHRIRDVSVSNGNQRKHVVEQADGIDTASIDSYQRYTTTTIVFCFDNN